MGKTGIIISVFFLTTSIFTVRENRQHTQQSHRTPTPITATTQTGPLHVTQNAPPAVHDEVCCEPIIPTRATDIRALQQAIRQENQEINKLKVLQAAFDRQLTSTYEKNSVVTKLQQTVWTNKHLRQPEAEDQAINDALYHWADHTAQIEHLARKNSSFRQYYLPEEARVGYAMNLAMTQKRRSQDKQRAAVDARIKYLNILYQHQQLSLRGRLNPRMRQLALRLPVYH